MEAEPAAPGGSEGAKRATATKHTLGGPDAEGTEDPLVSELWCAILAYANVAQRQRHGTLCQVGVYSQIYKARLYAGSGAVLGSHSCAAGRAVKTRRHENTATDARS